MQWWDRHDRTSQTLVSYRTRGLWRGKSPELVPPRTAINRHSGPGLPRSCPMNSNHLTFPHVAHSLLEPGERSERPCVISTIVKSPIFQCCIFWICPDCALKYSVQRALSGRTMPTVFGGRLALPQCLPLFQFIYAEIDAMSAMPRILKIVPCMAVAKLKGPSMPSHMELLGESRSWFRSQSMMGAL